MYGSEKRFAVAVREGCRELAAEVGRVSEWTRFKRERELCASLQRPDVGSKCSSSDEDEVSLAQRELRGHSQSVAATSGSLDTRSILNAVRYAENSYRRDACGSFGNLVMLTL